jgi:hypothetical protein
MAFTADQVTLVWPPTGLALAALLLYGRQAWAGVFIGAFIANATAHETLPVAFFIAIGNTLEAIAAAYLLRRYTGLGGSLDRLRRLRAGRLRRAPQHDDRRHHRRRESLHQRHAALVGVSSALVDVVARRRCRRDAVAPALLTLSAWPRLRRGHAAEAAVR